MDKETVSKQAEERPDTGAVGQGGTPEKKTDALIGAITKGSGDTKENQTTSVTTAEKPLPPGFLDKLGEIYTGEKELVRALPGMAKAAQSEDLKTALHAHFKETEGHVKALEQVAESLQEELPDKSCEPITQLTEEGDEAIGKNLAGPEQDAALIATGRKIEQFEIDSYTSLCATAKEKDYAHELALLASILGQEKMALDLLSGLAAGKGPLNPLVEKASLKHATEPGV